MLVELFGNVTLHLHIYGIAMQRWALATTRAYIRDNARLYSRQRTYTLSQTNIVLLPCHCFVYLWELSLIF